jgi:hypothetical protein
MRRWRDDPQAWRDAATLLPVVAAALLLPPFILVFAAPVRLAGIPLIVIYVFGAWALIVLAAWLLARGRMDAADDTGTPLDADREA